jgi:CHAT domain-containing protein
MMAVSRRVPYTWRCEACGSAQEAPVWRILDARERGDVVEEAGPGLADVTCGDCGARAYIDAPLLLIRPGNPLPLLLAMPVVALDDPGPWIHELGSEALEALGGDAAGITEPMMPLPRWLLPVVLGRDVMSDLDDPAGAGREVSDQDAAVAGWYYRFLELVRETEGERRLLSALQKLWSIPPPELAGFLADHPELGSRDAVSLVRAEVDNFHGVASDRTPFGRVATDESDEPLRARLALVEGLASGRPAADVAREYLAALERFGARVNADFDQLLTAVTENPGPGGIPMLRQAQQMANDLHYEQVEADLGADLAARLLALPRNSAEDTEEAIGLLRRSLSLLPEDDPRWLTVAADLAAAYNRRLSGDPVTKWEAQRELMERASGLCDRAADPRTWAVIQTNYGLLLAEHPGGGQDDLRRGIEHIQAGLEERSPQRNVVDWAYSLLNLGLLYSRSETAADHARARECYQQALAHLQPADDLILWTTLQNNLADVLLAADSLDLDAAESAARSALEVISTSDDPLTAGRLLWVLARVAEQRDGPFSAEAVRLRRKALDALPPRIAPDLHLAIGGELFEAYPQLGDWAALADVAASQLVAFSALYDAQTTAEGQRNTLVASGPVFARWAAYALARAGRWAEAVAAMEHGRTRQLSVTVGRDTADLARLGAIDAHLASRYRAALSSYRAALEGAGDRTSGASTPHQQIAAAERDMQQLLSEIRDIPGFERFLQPLTIADISSASGEHPIMYLVCAPWGSYALIVRPGGGGEPIVEAVAISEVTSTSVAQLVAVAPDGTPGLLAAQAADPERLLPAALDRLDEIAPLARPVAEALASDPDHVAVVVPTGLLGLVPLPAIPVPGTTGQVLDDIGEIHLAPSAAVYAACRARASRHRTQQKLAGVANPDGTLPWSQDELATIQVLFEPRSPASCAVGPQATRSWVLENIPGASHVHFACHGFSEPGNEIGGRLLLAGHDQLSIQDLIDGRLSGCRLATASACQSGHYTTSAPPDEFTGLPAGFLQAGAACTVVSLWPVYDEATALLMTRFYELLDPGSGNPGSQQPITAMRQARTWLRHLTEQEADKFISTHSHLARSNSPRRESRSPGTATTLQTLPCFSTQDWAAFSAWGY